MMALLKPSDPAFMTAEQAAQRGGHASRSELGLRNALEAFCRDRWPNARIVHEMVMGARQVRADVVAIDVDHIAAVEVKGAYDDTTRLLHQVGMYQLSVPEVWVVAARKHEADCLLIHHLLPSVGVIVGDGIECRYGEARLDIENVRLEVIHESVPREPAVDVMLEMMWRDELAAMCNRIRCFAATSKSTRPVMIRALRDLAIDELRREVCTELRARDALWRADAPARAFKNVKP